MTLLNHSHPNKPDAPCAELGCQFKGQYLCKWCEGKFCWDHMVRVGMCYQCAEAKIITRGDNE